MPPLRKQPTLFAPSIWRAVALRKRCETHRARLERFVAMLLKYGVPPRGDGQPTTLEAGAMRGRQSLYALEDRARSGDNVEVEIVVNRLRIPRGRSVSDYVGALMDYHGIAINPIAESAYRKAVHGQENVPLVVANRNCEVPLRPWSELPCRTAQMRRPMPRPRHGGRPCLRVGGR